MIEIRRVDSVAEFALLEREWNDLLRRSAADTIFLTHQWLAAWWEAFGTGDGLCVLLCTEHDGDGSRLVGILPAYIQRGRCLRPVRRLRFLGSEVVTSDFLDVIAASGRETEVVDAILDHLSRSGSAPILDLTDIREGSPLLQRVEGGEKGDGWRFHRWPVYKRCPVIALPADRDAYLAGQSRRFRRNFQYYLRHLQEQGMELQVLRTPEQIAEALGDFQVLHNSRRGQMNQGGIFATPQQQRFYADVLQRLARSGWVELIFMTVGGQRVAAACQFDYGNAVYYYQNGYDISWEKESVGFVLNVLLIERAIARGKVSYEFLRGEQEYKLRFGAHHLRTLYDICGTRGVVGVLFRDGRRVVDGCRKMAKRILRKA